MVLNKMFFNILTNKLISGFVITNFRYVSFNWFFFD